MSLGPTLTTARLILRPPQQDEFDGWAEFYGDHDNLRFIGGGQPRDAAWRFMATMAGSWALLGYGMFSVIERESGRFLGRLGPWRPGGEQGGWLGTEVGWGLVADAQGKGYAREGATAAIDWVFDHLGWTEVIHCIDKANTPSIAVAQRLGSTVLREDQALPPPFSTHIVDVWGQSRTQWRARIR